MKYLIPSPISLLLLGLLAAASNLYAEGRFEVIEFKLDRLSLRAQAENYKDLNGDLCARILVESDVAEMLVFEANDIKKVNQKVNGRAEVFLSFREERLTISCKGFLALPFKIPVKLEKGKDYVLRLRTVGGSVSQIPVVVRVTPEDAIITVDGGSAQSGISSQLRLGRHSIHIEKSGFESIQDSITVNLEHTYFEFDLKKQSICVVVVETTPPGATIKLDGIELKSTSPVTDFFKSGTYKLTASLPKYEQFEQMVTIFPEKKQNRFSFKLLPSFAAITVSSKPEVGFGVYLDGKYSGTSPLLITDILPGSYKVTGRHELYTAEEIPVNLAAGDTVEVTLKASSNFGSLAIKSEPEINLKVELDGKAQGETPLKLDQLPPGEYQITGWHEFYLASPKRVRVEKGKETKAVLTAEDNFATLNIKASPGATVYLNDSRISNLDGIKLTPRTVTLKAEKPKCQPAEQSLILRKGANETVTLEPTPMTGTIAVSVTPEGAEIELIGDAGERFTETGTQVFRDVPVGKYLVRSKIKGFKNVEEYVELKFEGYITCNHTLNMVYISPMEMLKRINEQKPWMTSPRVDNKTWRMRPKVGIRGDDMFLDTWMSVLADFGGIWTYYALTQGSPPCRVSAVIKYSAIIVGIARPDIIGRSPGGKIYGIFIGTSLITDVINFTHDEIIQNKIERLEHSPN